MEYERIDNPQSGIISPSKLRAKLMGVRVTQQKMKKEGSNSNSPLRLEDSEFVNTSLLSSNNDFSISSELPQKLIAQAVSSSMPPQNNYPPNEHSEPSNVKVQQSARCDNGNSSAVHPLKPNDEDNLDYDSNASSSSFEFHKGERVAHRSLTRSLSRPTSYKWNDAEKWIMGKQACQGNNSKSLNGGIRVTGMNMIRVTPEGMPEMKRFEPTGLMSLDGFGLAHPGVESHGVQLQSDGANVQVDLFPQSKYLREVGNVKSSTHDVPGTPAIRAISMRDMGTEMTPVTSLEPSRTATPNGSLTPLRSPTSSIPSTPRTGEPTTTPESHTQAQHPTENGSKELSEHELKLKTRREIVALGVQLGKMNIAAWASKDEKDKHPFPITDPEELQRFEFEKRAAAWEDAEKSKHAARYKREEIKIQAWESQQKAKLEQGLRRIEAKVERLRSNSQAKMMKKIAIARKRSEKKRAAAENQKRRQAEKIAAQADYIRQTGRNPPSDYICCGLFY